MVGGNNYRKSQFNLAVQGVRQPGSAFKPFVLATAFRQGISPATHFESKPQAINLGDKYWVVGNYDDQYLGSIDLETGHDRVGQRGVRAADPARRLEEGRRDRQADGDPKQARRVLRDRARRRGGESARACAGIRDARARRSPHRRRHVRQPAAGDHEGAGARAYALQRADDLRRALVDPGGDDQHDPAEGRPVRHGQARVPGRPPGRGEDRHDGELRRRVVRRLHAAARRRRLGRLPDDAEADADGVPRRRGDGWNLPGADLEVVRREGSAGQGGARGSRTRPSRTRRRSSSPGAGTSSCSTTASANRAGRSSTSPGRARRGPRTAS